MFPDFNKLSKTEDEKLIKMYNYSGTKLIIDIRTCSEEHNKAMLSMDLEL